MLQHADARTQSLSAGLVSCYLLSLSCLWKQCERLIRAQQPCRLQQDQHCDVFYGMPHSRFSIKQLRCMKPAFARCRKCKGVNHLILCRVCSWDCMLLFVNLRCVWAIFSGGEYCKHTRFDAWLIRYVLQILPLGCIYVYPLCQEFQPFQHNTALHHKSHIHSAKVFLTPTALHLSYILFTLYQVCFALGTYTTVSCTSHLNRTARNSSPEIKHALFNYNPWLRVE